MKKLPKDYYLSELFTNSLQGKSWLEVGNDLPEASAKLSRLNKCRDFKVASRTPRAPHMIRFAKEDLSAVADKSFDYVLFNWSIGMFSTEAILKEASRIAREGIIIQDYLLGELSPKVPNYSFYTDLQWREILNSFGQIHVEMQIPEQALELPMRKPPQVRLYVVQVADNRDTLPASSITEIPDTLGEGMCLTFRPPVDSDDFALNILAGSTAPACVGMPNETVQGPGNYYNGQDMVGDDTPIEGLPEELPAAPKQARTAKKRRR